MSNSKKLCCKCNKSGGTVICDGCQETFCIKHFTEHRRELGQQMNHITQQYETIEREFNPQNNSKILLSQIDRWEKESIGKIQNLAKSLRIDIKRLTEDTTVRLTNLMTKFSNEFYLHKENNEYIEDDLERWKKQVEEFRKEFERLSSIVLSTENSSIIQILKIKKSNSNSQIGNNFETAVRENILPETITSNKNATIERIQLNSLSTSYPCVWFGLHQSTTSLRIDSLFEYLMYLHPMEKTNVINNRYSSEVDQMERFLSQTFGFKNIPQQHPIQDIRSFQLDRLTHSIDSKTEIYFPNICTNSFVMTIEEVVKWQRSYIVYADKNIKGLNREFLHRASQGLTTPGETAFRMKFLVRISTCPILMESDLKILSRQLDDDWPHRLKLVSMTPINFSGQKHDIGDILYYISNWKDLFDLDPKTSLPLISNGKEFTRKINAPHTKLHEERIRESFMRMIRLRLRACDEEGVQIVIEPGIGLDEYAGSKLSIDRKVRTLYVESIRIVLQQYGSTYKNIRAIIFALPIFHKTSLNQPTPTIFNDFLDEFTKSKYNGPIPVLLVDQDIHRLAVAVARYGFIVSELCPANSYHIFGGYWQDKEVNCDEKIALTTLGLLIQHHLSNQEVLNSNKYHFLEINGRHTIDWFTTVSNENGKTLVNNLLKQ